MKYAEVILPLSLANSYTYQIPADLERQVVPGCRVIVHFGKKHYYTAIVMAVHDSCPVGLSDLKEIFSLLDDFPIVRDLQLRFWKWIASYYLCKLGDVYKAALPSGLKLESETTVSLNPDFEANGTLRPQEQAVLDAFAGAFKLTISDLGKKTGLRNIISWVTALMGKEAVSVSEELKRGFVPKKQTFIRLSKVYQNEAKLQEVFAGLKRAKKQEQLLLCFLDKSQVWNGHSLRELGKRELLKCSDCSPAILEGLLKRGILESYEKEIGRLQAPESSLQPLTPLSPAQQEAYEAVREAFRKKEACLLYGVTSSGKTEVYIHLIADVLKAGLQVLYLLPEIAITSQIMERLSKLFDDKLLVYHSKFSDNERVEVWNRLLHTDEPLLVLGVRSSIFLPFSRLGLVVVDEEHETSYKQQDPAPRYHARNAALVLAGMHGAKILLGSATPSLDSYYNALTGKYGAVELNVRYGNCSMPEILPVDIKELKRKKIMKDTVFSPILLEKMQEALEQHEQVILFQNRRGFAPVVECKSCGWIPCCVNCDVSLTYHKLRNELICHYCGYKMMLPPRCPACQGNDLKTMGFGTEKVEEEIARFFPSSKVARLDFDSARTRMAYERIIHDFKNGKKQILIGTQMLSKGLNFGNVSVVGILNADNLMNIPDFRAHERAFQLMIQVSGRAGWREKRGCVILQTSQPNHPLIQLVERFDYKGMARFQLEERLLFHYPPYYRLIRIVLRNLNEDTLQEMGVRYAEKLRYYLGERVLGPVIPPVTRVQTFHIRQLVLKIETTVAVTPIRKLLDAIHAEMQRLPAFKQLLVHYDVDPN